MFERKKTLHKSYLALSNLKKKKINMHAEIF
jgi:hypothetical protein